jgi:hypothetical protein
MAKPTVNAPIIEVLEYYSSHHEYWEKGKALAKFLDLLEDSFCYEIEVSDDDDEL